MNPTPLITLRIRTEQDVVSARQRSRRIASLLGFDSQEQTRIATAVSEIARNAFRYAGGGSVEFSVDGDLIIRISDNGPGIENLTAILQGRYRSETGMGHGIMGARRLMDEFRIDTVRGGGSTVTMRKRLPKRAPKLTPETLAKVADDLARVASQDPYHEIDVQNRELLQILEDLRTRQEELAQLNRELEDTNRGVVALYAELDEKAEHLKQADRLKSTFLSHMSHEFRTPLNSIMALSKILVDRLDGPLTDEQDKQVSFIHNAARELTDMVNDLLDIAKVEAGKIDIHASEFSPAVLLGTLRGMMRPLSTNPNVQLVFEENESLPAMFTDEAKVSQILRNFVSNAIKFTEHGEIRVKVSYIESTDAIAFTVSDSGIGIAPEEQDRLFQQYYQIDSARQRKVKGTGLGLALSKQLAELLGGSIYLKSEVGMGSQFTVRLPRRLETAAHRPISDAYASPAVAKPARARVPRVLVIDDEDVTRYLVMKLLSGLPAEVLEARAGQEGLQYAREQRVDLIVLDLGMPDSSGFQVIAELRAEPATRDIPVVIHTSMTLGATELEALSHARAIVSKSRTEPELRDVVKSLVASAGYH
jgi:signal transduction histidine kinase